jgi:hypothetical protein
VNEIAPEAPVEQGAPRELKKSGTGAGHQGRKYFMHRKLITACMALAAFAAFAVMPAIASATNDPDLTHPTGTLMPAGKGHPASGIKGTNVGLTLMTNSSGGILTECNSAVMTGTLIKNDGSNVEGNISSATFTGTASGGACTGSFGNVTVTTNPATNGIPWCLRSTSTMATDEFQVRGNECSKAARPIRFVLDIIFGGSCVYQRGTAIPGTFKTHPEDALLSISKVEFPLLEGGFACPSVGFLDMSFTLETDSVSTEPLYIS